MSGPVKILGDITDVNINSFAWMASGSKPGDDAYEKALVKLLSRGGDELRGVSDPLEKIFSAVSSYIEEYGMTPALRNQHTRITEALSEGRTISDFNKTYYEAMQYGETLRTAPEPTIAPKVSSSEPEPKLKGTLSKLRGTSSKETTPPVSEGPIEFKAVDVDDLYESSYLDFRDRLSSMSEKDRNNPKKMQRMKRAVEENSGFLAEGEIEEVLEEFNFGKVDPSNPKTWQKIGDKFDIGRPNLVSEKMAAKVEVDAYRKQVQAMEGLDRPALDLVEEQVSSFAGRILGQAGVDPSRTSLRDDYRLNYNKTMSGIYEQILEGVDPINALQNNIRTLGLPEEFDDFLINRVYSISDAAAAGIDLVEGVPYPKITQDIIDNITDEPVYFPAKEVIKTTEAVPSAEPEPKLRGTLVDKRAASGAVPDPTPAPAPASAAVPETSVEPEPKLRGDLVNKRAAAAAAPAPVDGPKPLVQPLEKDIKKFDWRNRRKNWKTPAKNANLNDR